MPRKEFGLLARDIGFFITGAADVAQSRWQDDARLYPLDWGYQLDRPHEYFSPADDAGVPMRELPAGLGLTYLASRIAGFACANWNRWCEQPDSDLYRRQFFVAADWFASHDDGLFWQRFDLLSLTDPWLTCINQGEGASVLVRAYQATGNDRYGQRALAAIEPMFRAVADGGLQERLPDGSPFVEEYPGTEYRHVINGCLYALVGLHDVAASGLDDSGRVAALRDAILDGIERNLAGWEVGDWTTYDFRPPERRGSERANPNTLTYQTLQWIQLDYLGRQCDRPVLVAAAARWRRASRRPLDRVRALVGKMTYRIAHGYRV